MKANGCTQVQIIPGYRDELFLTEELGAARELFMWQQRMAVREQREMYWMPSVSNGIEADVIYACGPKPMLRAIKAYAEEKRIECYLSMEERMACGIGACLACVCQSKEKDEHSQVHNKRICKDGPVFLSDGGGAVMNTKVTIAGVELKNPVMTASGTFGSGAEFSEFYDLGALGAVVTKGVANVPWPGNPTPRDRRDQKWHAQCHRSPESGN